VARLADGIFGAHFASVGSEVDFKSEAQASAEGVALRTAGLGWEVINLHNNGVDFYTQILRDVKFLWLDLDVSYMITSIPSSPNFAEVLFTMGLSKERPKFTPPPQVYDSPPISADFREFEVYNPNKLKIVGGGNLAEGQLVRLILKSWVPADGSCSQDSRHVYVTLGLSANKGDYLVFHADHAGVEVDFEVQGVIAYEYR